MANPTTGWQIPDVVSLAMDDLRAAGLPEVLFTRVEHRLAQAYTAGWDNGYDTGFLDGDEEGYMRAMEDARERRSRGIR